MKPDRLKTGSIGTPEKTKSPLEEDFISFLNMVVLFGAKSTFR
jgi:hypothetical protein